MEITARLLNKYGDGLLFGAVAGTPPIACNPGAATGVHTAVPHRYRYAYLVAIKSLLRYRADLAVYVHDDGTLSDADKALIEWHVPGAVVIGREVADRRFAEVVGDEFLTRVRGSYTSYLKLFDPTLFSTNQRIVVVDTDVLFLRRPDAVIEWARHGGPAWYHRGGAWYLKPPEPASGASTAEGVPPTQHIQQLVEDAIDEIGDALHRRLAFVHGFNSGFIGYDRDTVQYGPLKELLAKLHSMFGDQIFRWGAEQTVHGLVLCSLGATALPMNRYMIHTEANRDIDGASLVHFIGEFRFQGLRYPRLAAKVIRELRRGVAPDACGRAAAEQ